jgi:SAM-dependent methyltransferase
MAILYKKDWVNEEWFTEDYQAHKRENFELLDAYLKTPPKRILDIGCGLAWESRMFNEKYGTELYLLDGDYDDNPQDRELVQARYSEDAGRFAFYYKLDFLRDQLDKLGTKDYRLIDSNNVRLPWNIKFDLITSWVSCGFHYPVNTYRDLILKHSNKNTRVVMDLRMLAKTQDPVLDDNIELVEIVNKRRKYVTAEIKIS